MQNKVQTGKYRNSLNEQPHSLPPGSLHARRPGGSLAVARARRSNLSALETGLACCHRVLSTPSCEKARLAHARHAPGPGRRQQWAPRCACDIPPRPPDAERLPITYPSPKSRFRHPLLLPEEGFRGGVIPFPLPLFLPPLILHLEGEGPGLSSPSLSLSLPPRRLHRYGDPGRFSAPGCSIW